MPIHPRVKTILALACLMVFAQASATYAGVPIHLTERSAGASTTVLTAFAQKPIHLTGTVVA